MADTDIIMFYLGVNYHNSRANAYSNFMLDLKLVFKNIPYSCASVIVDLYVQLVDTILMLYGVKCR